MWQSCYDWADGKNDVLADSLHEVGSKAFFNSLLQYPLTQSLSLIQIVLVMVAGALMVVGGETDLGTVIAFAGYAALLTKPLSEIANLTSTTFKAERLWDLGEKVWTCEEDRQNRE